MTEQRIGKLANKTVTPWRWWQAALNDPDGIGRGKLTVSELHPEQGYYRTRSKGGDWEPVAIFYNEGELVGLLNGRTVNEVERLWVFCCRHPITYKAYKRAMAGDGWADEPPKPDIGHNIDSDDPFATIKAELKGDVDQAHEFIALPIETKESADKVGIWAKRIRDLGKRAEDERKREKQPHLDGGRAVDEKWSELTNIAAVAVKQLKEALQPYLIEQRRLEQERAKRAAEEAERQRETARDAADDEVKEAALAAAKEAEERAKPKNAQAGRTGAKVSIRVTKKAEITDYDALLAALKDRREIKALVQSLADRAAKSGFELAGMTIVEVETVV